MKTYYQQLRPIVLAHVQHYLTDFTKHDRKALRGYTGEFFYAIRKTGTDLFCVNPVEKALRDLLNEEKNYFFTSKGIRELREGKFDVLHCYTAYAVLSRDNQERFFVGKNGTIKEFDYPAFERLFNQMAKRLNQMAGLLAGSNFLYLLEREILKQEDDERRKRNEPSSWLFSTAY